MYASNTWHSEGLRWIASQLTDLADFLDRMDSAPGGRASTAIESSDDIRARMKAGIPYY